MIWLIIASDANLVMLTGLLFGVAIGARGI